MKIKELDADKYKGKSKKLDKRIATFQKLVESLNEKEIKDNIATEINVIIDSLNASSTDEKAFRKQLYKTQTKIIALLKKELKIVPKNHYRNVWMGVGMAAFGVPVGVSYGVVTDNMGLLAVGIPIGMVIGMAVGAGLDKKAKQEGKQLDIEIEL